ncbi:hypothetical protein IWQ61_005751 [Dispira simplex]|nr:hypothetical protein IWQ61_005751 [Dispira simplex]
MLKIQTLFDSIALQARDAQESFGQGFENNAFDKLDEISRTISVLKELKARCDSLVGLGYPTSLSGTLNPNGQCNPTDLNVATSLGQPPQINGHGNGNATQPLTSSKAHNKRKSSADTKGPTSAGTSGRKKIKNTANPTNMMDVFKLEQPNNHNAVTNDFYPSSAANNSTVAETAVSKPPNISGTPDLRNHALSHPTHSYGHPQHTISLPHVPTSTYGAHPQSQAPPPPHSQQSQQQQPQHHHGQHHHHHHHQHSHLGSDRAPQPSAHMGLPNGTDNGGNGLTANQAYSLPPPMSPYIKSNQTPHPGGTTPNPGATNNGIGGNDPISNPGSLDALIVTPTPIPRNLSHAKANASRTHAELPANQVQQLDEIFFTFLQGICSNLNATDSKGESIHQTLMAKKMQKLDETPDFRPFRFRIQAFTNAFHEELIRQGITEEVISARKVKVYLWRQRFISRYNEDGRKSKSKGNHVWNVEAKKLPAGGWVFREFVRKFIPPPPKTAWVGIKFEWAPRLWDPQVTLENVMFQSPWLPDWLKWENGVLSGVPTMDAQTCEIKAVASVFERDTGKFFNIHMYSFLLSTPVDVLGVAD